MPYSIDNCDWRHVQRRNNVWTDTRWSGWLSKRTERERRRSARDGPVGFINKHHCLCPPIFPLIHDISLLTADIVRRRYFAHVVLRLSLVLARPMRSRALQQNRKRIPIATLENRDKKRGLNIPYSALVLEKSRWSHLLSELHYDNYLYCSYYSVRHKRTVKL